MNSFTVDYQLSTGLTNIVILIVSIYSLLTIKKKEWKLFFLLMSIDSFLGSIVHLIRFNIIIDSIIWITLSITFVLTINTLLNIFLKIKIKYCLLLSLILSIVLLIQLFLKVNFLLTFTIYVLLVMIITFYSIIKNNYKNKIWFIIGYLVQVIGGIIFLSKISIPYLNYNGIYHLFMALTLIFFTIGIKKDKQ